MTHIKSSALIVDKRPVFLY